MAPISVPEGGEHAQPVRELAGLAGFEAPDRGAGDAGALAQLGLGPVKLKPAVGQVGSQALELVRQAQSAQFCTFRVHTAPYRSIVRPWVAETRKSRPMLQI